MSIQDDDCPASVIRAGEARKMDLPTDQKFQALTQEAFLKIFEEYKAHITPREMILEVVPCALAMIRLLVLRETGYWDLGNDHCMNLLAQTMSFEISVMGETIKTLREHPLAKEDLGEGGYAPGTDTKQ